MRTCRTCKKDLPATTEYFNKDRHRLRAVCKLCVKVKFDVYRKNNKAKIRETSKAYVEKNKEKTADYMKEYGLANAEKKRAYDAERYLQNSDKYKEKSRVWYEDNLERVKERSSEYRSNNREFLLLRQRESYWPKYYEKNKEKILALGKEYREKNKEIYSIRDKEYRLKNADKIKAAQRKYRQENKGKINHWSQQRIAMRKKLISTLTHDEWEECLSHFDFKDAYTGLPMEKATKDHVIPVSKDGGYIKSNIVPCDMITNVRKSNRDMEVWFREQPFFCEKRLKKIYKWINFDEKNNAQQLAFF